MPKIIWGCDVCGTSFWSEQKPAGESWLCPNCLQGSLAEAGSETLSQLFVPEPEGVIPFSFTESHLQASLARFMQRIPAKPRDLTFENLASRLQKVYMPYWWVDVDVKAQWQAEVGFDYQVVSHQDSFSGQWESREVQETRIRWEPRVGLLEKHYDNIPAPAIQDIKEFEAQSGGYTLSSMQPGSPECFAGALVRIAQRDTKDAWTDAEWNVTNCAGEDCGQACQAQHVRQFKWTADYQNQHWTQLLLPVYITYYHDPNRRRRWVMINGQSGRVSGETVADLKAALLYSVRFLVVALVLGVLGLIFSLFSVPGLSTLLILTAIGVGAFAFYPFGRAWLFNQNQQPDQDGALT